MKRKGKIIMIITIGILCFLLVSIMFMQFKVVYETDITSIDTMRTDELQGELASWKLKYEEVVAKYAEVSETLKKYNEESTSDVETKKNLENELSNLQIMLGTTDVEGAGIVITLSDGDDVEKKVDASELMIIVNFLKEGGAEAISINNQRIVNTTDFVNIGETNSFIKINGQIISGEYTIKVIGDADYLKSSLIGPGYVNKIKGWGQEIKFDEKKKIEISKYDGDMSTKYISE